MEKDSLINRGLANLNLNVLRVENVHTPMNDDHVDFICIAKIRYRDLTLKKVNPQKSGLKNVNVPPKKEDSEKKNPKYKNEPDIGNLEIGNKKVRFSINST